MSTTTHINRTNVRSIPTLTKKITDRFWSKVSISGNIDSCWEWNRCTKGGYGSFQIGRSSYPSHRIAYLNAHKVDPYDKQVCHKCDNRRCCNPHHLFLGTNAENIADAVSKGRIKSKLIKSEVTSIRDMYYSEGLPQSEIASKFNISRCTVSGIILGKQWRHVSQETKKEVKGHGNSKLSETDVLDIRRKFNCKERSIEQLSEAYGVKSQAIYYIVNGMSWKHLLPKKEKKNLKFQMFFKESVV